MTQRIFDVDNLQDVKAQKFTVAENMKKYGGSFAQALGVALSHADMWNTIKIKLTWPELWEEYLNFEKTKDSSNEEQAEQKD